MLSDELREQQLKNVPEAMKKLFGDIPTPNYDDEKSKFEREMKAAGARDRLMAEINAENAKAR